MRQSIDSSFQIIDSARLSTAPVRRSRLTIRGERLNREYGTKEERAIANEYRRSGSQASTRTLAADMKSRGCHWSRWTGCLRRPNEPANHSASTGGGSI